MSNFIITGPDLAEEYGRAYIAGSTIEGFSSVNINNGNRESVAKLVSPAPVGITFGEAREIDVITLETTYGHKILPGSIRLSVHYGSWIVLPNTDYTLFCKGSDNFSKAQYEGDIFILLNSPIAIKGFSISFQTETNYQIEVRSVYAAKTMKIFPDDSLVHGPSNQDSSKSGKNIIQLENNRVRTQTFGGLKISRSYNFKGIGEDQMRFLEHIEPMDSIGVIDWSGRFLHCLIEKLTRNDKRYVNDTPSFDATMRVREI